MIDVHVMIYISFSLVVAKQNKGRVNVDCVQAWNSHLQIYGPVNGFAKPRQSPVSELVVSEAPPALIGDLPTSHAL